MEKYRIKEHIYGRFKNYEIQKLSIFGFWYNPDNVDAYTTGFYDKLEDAEECIRQKLMPRTSKVVREF